MVKKWRQLQSRVVFEHPRLVLTEDIVELPNGKELPYLRTVPATSHSVAILAFNKKEQLLVQREYSYPPNEVMWQLPGGSIEKGEDILAAAKRELAEESGYIAKNYQIIGYFFYEQPIK